MNRCLLATLAAALAWGAAPPSPKPVTVTLVAVEATREGRAQKYFEPGLESIRNAVAELDYDTFKKVASERRTAPYDAETKFSVTSKCALYITPRANEPDGRVKIEARVEMINEKTGKPRNALKTTSSVVPGDPFKFRIKMDQGELVLILTISL